MNKTLLKYKVALFVLKKSFQEVVRMKRSAYEAQVNKTLEFFEKASIVLTDK